MADQASETDNVNTDGAVVNADSANVLNVLMDAVGGVGDFITGVDTSKTDGKSTVSGAQGFIDNTQSMSGKDIGRLADSTLTKLTSNDYVQQQVANSISNLLGTGDVDLRGDDPQRRLLRLRRGLPAAAQRVVRGGVQRQLRGDGAECE